MDVAQRLPRGWGQNSVLTDCDVSTCLHHLLNCSLLLFYVFLPLCLLFPFLFGIISHLPICSMLPFYRPSSLSFHSDFHLLTCISALCFLCSPRCMPSLSWTCGTLKEKVWSLSWRNYKLVEEKNSAIWNVWKWKPIETLFLLLSVFFPCAIWIQRCFPTQIWARKSLAFCGIISWYRGWTFCYQRGWSQICIPFSFELKEMYL